MLIRLFLVLIFVLFVSGCSQPVKEHVDFDSVSKTYTIYTWSIFSENKFVGTLKSTDESYVSFKLPWRIKKLYVKEWDVVKKGQLLAELDWNEVKTKFHSVNDMIKSLQTVYKNTESLFDAQITAMKVKIQQAKSGMEWTQIWLKDTKSISKEKIETAKKQVEQAKIWVETAKTNLEHTKNVLSNKEGDIYSNAKNAISSARILETNFLNFVDEVFWISEKRKHDNDAFERYLSSKKTALKDEIEKKWNQLNNEYKDFDSKLWDLNTLTKEQIEEKLQKMQDILEKSRALADLVYDAFDNSVSWRTLPQSKIDEFKKQIVAYQNQIEQAQITAKWNYLLWIKWSLQAIQEFKKQKSMKLDLLEKQYEQANAALQTAQQALNQYKAMASWNINSVNTKYTISKQQYEEALRWLEALKKQKQTQLSNISSQIANLKWNKNLASVNLWNIKLYAPYDAIVLQKMTEVWQVVWAWTPVFKIWTLKNLEWVFYVPVGEVSKIKVWDIVYIKALWKTVTWAISLIHPQADPISKKITVEVSIPNVPKEWKNGIYITWYPKSQQITWLVVPYDMIRYEYWRPYVYKKTDKWFEKTYITLWACDNDFCLVESWLDNNDIIR